MDPFAVYHGIPPPPGSATVVPLTPWVQEPIVQTGKACNGQCIRLFLEE